MELINSPNIIVPFTLTEKKKKSTNVIFLTLKILVFVSLITGDQRTEKKPLVELKVSVAINFKYLSKDKLVHATELLKITF